jgi:hypothetical protein
MKANLYVGTALTAVAMAAAYAFVSPSATLAADGAPLLAGKVVSSTGEALVGIPIKAHRDNSTITVAVYTDAKGEYSFPTWSDLTPGSYSVAVEVPDFEHTAQPVAVSDGKPAKIDFMLKSRPLAYEDATASEIIAALPGTDHQKVLFSQCSNCHTLQWALQAGRTKEGWVEVIKKMAGRAAEQHQPGTYAFSQMQFIEPLAEYLTSIRGPDSSDKIPFKQRPRPTDAASTNLVVTEYALPRGGARELYMLRGDRRFVWPHDVIMNDQYAYYTDHFSYVLGRIDRKTGAGTEIATFSTELPSVHPPQLKPTIITTTAPAAAPCKRRCFLQLGEICGCVRRLAELVDADRCKSSKHCCVGPSFMTSRQEISST